MPWAPASMLRMKRSWPGHVHHARPDTARQIEVGEPELDRDAALLFLLEAVGVLAGERFDEARLPVIDVSGRADDPVGCVTRAPTVG